MKTIQEQSNNRKQEIIQTVNKMFDEMDYQDISMKTISEHISISRPALYCYYNSKEEIMLEILKADYLKFISDITNAISNGNDLTKDITNIYLSNIRLLKIVSTYLTDIETHVSIDCLVEFKKPLIMYESKSFTEIDLFYKAGISYFSSSILLKENDNSTEFDKKTLKKLTNIVKN